MRKLVILALLAALPLACGNKSTNSNNGVSVLVEPKWATVDLDTTFLFSATVYGSSDQQVTWELEGDTTYGTISQSGLYHAPHVEPANVDSIKVSAHSVADLSAIGVAWVFLQDPTIFYISTIGHDDTLGDGSLNHPFRTITYALNLSRNPVHSRVQILKIQAGTYDATHGEHFPLTPRGGLTLQGAGMDSTFIVGPGGSNPITESVIALDNIYDIVIENLNIANPPSGTGIWLRRSSNISILRNQIDGCLIGMKVDSSLSISSFEGNKITGDTIGISLNGVSNPVIRSCDISGCFNRCIEILGHAMPNLGTIDSLFYAGNDSIDFGQLTPSGRWLIYNLNPDTIWAVGDHWPFNNDGQNDLYIYDDNESGGASGPVMMRRP